jgi:hypothetical protein
MSDPLFLDTGWAFPPSIATGGADVEMVSGVEGIQQSLQILRATARDRTSANRAGADYGCLISCFPRFFAALRMTLFASR